MPILPLFGDLNVSTPVVLVFVYLSTSVNFVIHNNYNALAYAIFADSYIYSVNKFSGPSALSEPLFLIAPTSTTGLSLFTTKFRK